MGEILERLGTGLDLALVFVTPHHAGALEDVAAVVRTILRPTVVLGCAAVGVLATGYEVEGDAGVSLWAGRFGPVESVHLAMDPDTRAVTGWKEPSFEPKALVLLADPFSFDAAGLFDVLDHAFPGMPVIGGNASAAAGPGGNRLVVDAAIADSGAVGAFLGPGVDLATVVSQGCRPIGRPWVVTRAERNVIYEMGGEPAYARLLHIARHEVPPEDIALINQGLHIGLVIDESKPDFGRGDFLIKNVLGADREVGAVAVGDIIPVGATVQYQVRDGASASEDLELLLASGENDDVAGALLFTCNGRGQRLFGVPHHDAGLVDDHVGVPVAGFFAAGEFGPIGGKNFVHGFTASVALLREARL